MPLYSGTYRYHDTEDARQKRAAVSDGHVKFFEELVAHNVIVMATVHSDDDPPGGQIVIRADSREAAEAMFDSDPNTDPELGRWELNEFRVVAGSLMAELADPTQS